MEVTFEHSETGTTAVVDVGEEETVDSLRVRVCEALGLPTGAHHSARIALHTDDGEQELCAGSVAGYAVTSASRVAVHCARPAWKHQTYVSASINQAAVLSPCATLLCAGTASGTALYNLVTGEQVVQYTNGTGAPMDFIASDEAAARCQQDSTQVKVFSPATQEVRLTLSCDGDINSVVHTPCGLAVLTSRTLQFFCEESGAEYTALRRSCAGMSKLRVAPDAMHFAAVHLRTRVVLLDSSGTTLAEFSAHDAAVRVVVFSPCSTLLASGADDCTVALFSVTSCTQIRRFECESYVLSCAFSPCARYLYTGLCGGSVGKHDVREVAAATGEGGEDVSDSERHSYDLHGNTWAMCVSPCGGSLASLGVYSGVSSVIVCDPQVA